MGAKQSGIKHFFRSLSWLLALNLLVKPVWIFVIDRQVQNIVGHEVYGIYFALFNLCYILLFIADAGLGNMLTQRLASNESLNVRQLMKLKAGLLLFYAVTCLAIASMTSVTHWPILLYLILIQSLTSFFIFLRSLLTARQHFKTDAFFSVVDKTLLLLLCIGPVYGFFSPMTILLFLQLQTASISVAVVSLLVRLAFKKEITTGNIIPVKTLVRYTTPFILIILLMSTHNRLDAFLLERLHPDGAYQAGIYAMAYRLLDAANVVGYLTGSFLLPFLSRNQPDKPLVQRVLLLSRHGLLFVSAGVVAFVFVFAPWLQQVLYHTRDVYSSKVMQLCLASLPAYYLIHIYGSALTAMRFFKPFILLVLVFTVINTILNVWLVPRYGALGCNIAALISQYGCSLLLWVAASRKLQISCAAGTALLYPAAVLVFGSLFYLGQKLTENVWIILSSIALFVLTLFIVQRNSIKKVFLSFYK